jgi:hypothetical protein
MHEMKLDFIEKTWTSLGGARFMIFDLKIRYRTNTIEKTLIYSKKNCGRYMLTSMNKK